MSTNNDFENASNLIVATLSYCSPTLGLYSAFVKETLERVLKNRTQKATDILLSELKYVDNYKKIKEDPDSFIAHAARYHQAAIIGAAHTNLRILARLVIYGGESKAIVADDFLYLAQTIESLRHDELVVLASFIRARKKRDQNRAIDADGDLWPEIKQELREIYHEKELKGLASALSRTGFIHTETGFGGGGRNVTPILMRLEQTIQFSEAIATAKAS